MLVQSLADGRGCLLSTSSTSAFAQFKLGHFSLQLHAPDLCCTRYYKLLPPFECPDILLGIGDKIGNGGRVEKLLVRVFMVGFARPHLKQEWRSMRVTFSEVQMPPRILRLSGISLYRNIAYRHHTSRTCRKITCSYSIS